MGYLQKAAAPHHLHRHALPIPRWLIHFGIPGVFVVSVIDASVIPLPLPGSTDLLVLLLAARHSTPWLVVLAAVSGSVLGGYLTWSAGKKGGEAMLERYVPKRFREPLSRWVKQHGITSVAFPSISTGAYGFPLEPAARIAVSEVKNFLERNETVTEVVLVCFMPAVTEIYVKAINNVFR